MKKSFLFMKMLLFAVFLTNQVHAQISAYTFSQSTGTYADVGGATVLATSSSNSLVAAGIYNTVFNLPSGSFPFTFTYNGVGYTGCDIHSNGFITFGAVPPTATLTAPLSSTVAYDGAISAWGRSLNAPFLLGGKTGSLSWGVEGVAPNRTIVIQWKDFRPGSSTSTTVVPFINFQIRLKETTNNIEFHYGDRGMAVGTTNTSLTSQIGLRGTTNVFGTNVINRTNTTTVAFTSSTAGTLNSSTQSWSTVNATPGMPSNGLIYTWTAPTCFAPTQLTNTLISQTDVNHSWNASPTPTNYEYEVSTSATPPASGTTTTSTTYSSTGLTPNTTYYLHVRSNCGGSFSPWSTASFYTGYCLPSSTGQLSWVSSFTTTGAVSNMNYTSGAGAVGGYSNQTATSLSNYVGNPTNLSLTAGGPTCGFAIWVDWNNNFVFEAGERMFNTTSYVTTTTGSFAVPGGTALGNYRMRLVVDFNSSNPTLPCATITRGEFIDYTFTVVAPPSCLTPTALTNVLVGTTAANHTWTAPASGTTPVGYDWAVTTSTATPTSWSSSATNAASSSGLTPNTTYYLHVRSDCGGGDLSNWVVSGSFFTGYCTPTYSTGKTSGDLISNVTIVGTTLDNNSGTAAVNPAYTYFTGAANLTGDLSAGTSYTVSVSVGTWGNQYIKAWIDFNDNLVFEASELIGSSVIAPGQSNTGPFPPATFTISLPCNPSVGLHRMRVRSNWNSATFDACSNQSFGECEDYDVTVLAPPPCPSISALANNTVTPTSANVTWTAGCVETAWDVDVSLSATPSVTPSNPLVASTTFAASGLTPVTLYYVHVRANCAGSTPAGIGESAWTTTSFTTPPLPPANDDCIAATSLTVNTDLACGTVTAGTLTSATASTQPNVCGSGTPNNDVWYSFVATGTAHKVSILNVAGTPTNMYHSIYDGTIGCAAFTAPMLCNDNDVSDLTGLTIGNTYYVRVYSWDALPGATTTFNMCVGTPPPPPANDECAGALSVTVNPTLVCTSSTAGTLQSATESPDANSCTGTDDDDVWFSFVAAGPVHTINLNNIVGSTTDLYHAVFDAAGGCGALGTALLCSDPNNSTVSGLTAGNTYYIRVYSWTATTGQNSTFDVCVGTPPPPPANDNCSAATLVPVNGNASCAAYVSGSIAWSTASPEANNCTGTDDDDVWYRFVATAATHTINLNNVAGSTTDLYHAVYDGAGGCGALGTALVCSDPNNSAVSGLTVGNTYYIRVYSWTATTGQTSTFDICIGTPPPPPANDECANSVALTVNADYLCGAVTSGTVNGATASAEANSCFGTDDDDVWYTFVATNTNHRVSLVNVAGSTTDMYMAIFNGAGGCGSLGTALLCSDPNVANLTGLTVGNTYYVRVYTWTSTAGQTSTFDICVGTPPPPPANDNCSAPTALTVNPDYLCGAVTFGTVASATASPEANTCTNVNDEDDVWYSFVATSPNHRISLNNIDGQGGSTDMYHVLYDATAGCGALTQVFCSDANQSDHTTLVPGTTYYVRVYTNLTTVQTTTFNMCIGTLPNPPANDECAGAFSFGSLNQTPSCQVVELQSATLSQPLCLGTTATNDVWYTFTVPTSAGVGAQVFYSTTNITGLTNRVFEVFNACGGTSLFCSDPESGSWVLNPGTYRLRTHTTVTGTSRFTLCLSIPMIPSNDNICSALTLKPTSGTSLNTWNQLGGLTCNNRITNTQAATATGAIEGSCEGTNGKSVWYRFTTPACVVGGVVPFQIEMTTDNAATTYDTKLELFSSSDGTCNGTLTSIQCNADNLSSITSCGGTATLRSTVVRTDLLPNTNYFVLVDGFNGASGTVEVSGRALMSAPITLAVSPTQLSVSTPDRGASLYTYFARQVGSTGFASSNSTSLSRSFTVANGQSYETQVVSRCTSASSQWYRTPMAVTNVPTVAACTAVSDLSCTPGAVSGWDIAWSEVSGLFTNGGLLSGYQIYYRVIGASGYSLMSNPTVTCTGGVCSYSFPGLTNPAGYEFWIKTRCSSTILLQSNTTTCSGIKSATGDIFSFVNPTTGVEFVDMPLSENWNDFGLEFRDLGDYYVGINKDNEIYAEKIGEANLINFGDDVSFELVPNPTNASTSITFKHAIKTGTFTVVDAMGREILSGDISNTNVVELDGSNWNAGVYLVNVTTNDKTTMRRLVISK